MPPVIGYKTPAWADPQEASVTDSWFQWAARKLGGLVGADDPASQVMGLAGALETGPAQGIKKAIKAYHGSPHDFPKFKLSAVGTGEGGQAYGHGLYFAEAEPVAQEYKRQLGKVVPTFGDEAVKTPAEGMAHDILSRTPGMNAEVRQNIYGDKKFYLVDRTSGEWGTHGFATRPEAVAAATDQPSLERAQRMVDEWAEQGVFRGPNEAKAILDVKRAIADNFGKPLGTKIQGHMYEVAIHADPETFLDWDKPLSEQSQKVQEAVKQLHEHLSPRITKAPEWLSPGGQQVVEDLTSSMPGEWGPQRSAAASAKLRAAGIPGIRYLDQGSRAAGEGSRNYVVFDEDLIEIARKYGIPLAALSGEMARRAQGIPLSAIAETRQQEQDRLRTSGP